MNINIDPEFKSLIPPLSNDEYAQLEANLKIEGCRDPLVTWNGTLIDGHNRLEICSVHGIAYMGVDRAFADRSEVIEWIIRNQFGRRNLDGYQRTKLALRLEETIAARAKEHQVERKGNQAGNFDKIVKVDPINTRAEIAKAAGVSEGQVAKVKQIEKSATPEVKEALANGQISINKAHNTVKAHREPAPEPDALVVDESKPAKRDRLPKYIPNDARDIWNVAQTHLDRILSNDISRHAILLEVINYCQQRISANK